MKNRVEFLFPNIKETRKLKWLENASFEKVLTDYDITHYTFEQFMEKYITDYCTWINLYEQDCTKEYYQNFYKEFFLSGLKRKMYELDGEDVKWDNEKIRLLIETLNAHPLSIPRFLQENTIDIIGNFFGLRAMKTLGFYNSSLLVNQSQRNYIYKKSNLKAKYRLSLFMAVINGLLAKGINIGEYKFGDLDNKDSFFQLKKSSNWNEKLISAIDDKGYTRIDGQHFTRAQIIDFLQFDSILDFFDKVVALTNVEYYICFIEDAKMLDPNSIISLKEHCPSLTPMGVMVPIEEECSKIKKKILEVMKISEYTVFDRHLKELADLIKNYVVETNFDVKFFPPLTDFYELLDGCDENTKAFWQKAVGDLLKKNNLKDKMPVSTNIQNSSKVNEEMKTYEAKLLQLNEKMNHLEKRLNDIEQRLINYFENGGKNPLTEGIDISEDALMAMLAKINPESFGGKIIKMKIINGLKGGAIGLLMGMLLTAPHVSEPTMMKYLRRPVENVVGIPQNLLVKNPVKFYELFNSLRNERQDLTEEEIQVLTLEIIRGNYGNGEDRRKKLEEDGYDYNFIQSQVNLEYEKRGLNLKKM